MRASLIATLAAGLVAPVSVVGAPRVFVTNEKSDDVTVIELAFGGQATSASAGAAACGAPRGAAPSRPRRPRGPPEPPGR
jgi:hypothetical protein